MTVYYVATPELVGGLDRATPICVENYLYGDARLMSLASEAMSVNLDLQKKMSFMYTYSNTEFQIKSLYNFMCLYPGIVQVASPASFIMLLLRFRCVQFKNIWTPLLPLNDYLNMLFQR